ncbi:MAG: ATP-binding protein [Melioribacter sp.]|nr:ATP-binding protein [Melioribacter sp.]
MNFLKTCTILINLLLIEASYAQNLRFESLTSEDGLSQNTVLSILQDSEGFLWFGTYDGLNRYDGYSFKIYKIEKGNPKSIQGQTFRSIVEDKDGNLWIASVGGGLNRYNRITDDFTNFLPQQNNPNSLISNRVRTLLIDKKGRLWIGTEEGLCRYDFKENKFINYTKILNNDKYPYSKYVVSICEDSSGFLWLGTQNGLIKFNPENNFYKYYFNEPNNEYSISGNFVGKVYVDKSNTLWIGTGDCLHKYDRKLDRFIRYINPYTVNSKDKTITDIIEDKFGNLWITTLLNGLQRFDRNNSSFTVYTHDPSNPESIGSNILFSLYEDRTGILWIGTEGAGANKLYRMRSYFQLYKNIPLNKNSLSYNKVYSIIEDKNGIVWIGTFGGGLNRFDPDSKEQKFTRYNFNPHNKNSLVDDRIRTMCEDNEGNIWIGTEYGLSKFNPKKNMFTNFISDGSNGNLSNNIIFSIYQIKTGEILIGTFGGGLNIYNKKTNTFTVYKHNPNNPKSISSNNIWCIFQDSKGNIWIGTDDGGLNRFDISKGDFYHYKRNLKDPNSISSNKILNITEDSKGNLWIGTIEGLNKAIMSNDNRLKFISYSVEDGLPDNNIQAILEDHRGNLWISTNKGISKFNPEKKTFKNYDALDGLQSNEFFVRAAVKRKKTGEMIFGGNNGFNIFHPDSLKEDTSIPNVFITEFLILNKPVKIGEKYNGEIALTKNITETKEIKISYKSNIITIKFAALHFAKPGKNMYAFKMAGLESDWNYVGNQNFAYYAYIPPGEYTFYVKAANPDGYWNTNGAKLKLIITPPFYETTNFRVAVILFILSIVYVGYLYKLKSIKKHEKELENLIQEKTKLNEELIQEIEERKKIEKELIKAREKAESSERLKSEFLAQMSHEIRSPIHTILNFSELIKEQITPTDNEIIKESFDSIERAGERIVRTIDLILNMSELQAGSYECIYKDIDINDILRKLYPEFSYKAKKKNLELIYNINEKELKVNADEYSVTQIFINLIENAIKYTNTGKVEVSSYLNQQNQIVVKVSDTGIGISEEFIPKLFTLFNQEQRGYTREFEGNGLGLALVKKYCELNNAQISVESKKGIGSTFTVTFIKNKN